MMKLVKYQNMSYKEDQNLVRIGSCSDPVSYTKDDFLTASMIAKQYGIQKKFVLTIMQKLYTTKAPFVLNGHKTQIVIKFKGKRTLSLHPMATDIFKQYLQQNQRN